MPFALLQTRLEIPEVEALRRAFRGVGGMSPVDAPHVARDAFGVLVKDLESADALALQGSLAREGIGTVVVDHADLPELPPAKFLRRVALRPEGFVGCDPYDRELVIPWAHLALVSTGLVLHTEIQRRLAASPNVDEWADAADILGAVTGVGPVFARPIRNASLSTPVVSTAEKQVWRWTADLFLTGGTVRFVLRPDQIHFLDPNQKSSDDAESNFLELIRAIATQAPRAILNRVAYALREGYAETIPYPSRNAYHEELIWLLWRLRLAT